MATDSADCHEEPQPSPKGSIWTRTKRFTKTSWVTEYIAVFISAGTLASIVVLLATANGIALEDWQAQLPINTIISILSTIFKASLAYAIGACIGQCKWAWLRRGRPSGLQEFIALDQASRGPLGCVGLLYRLKSWHFGSLGAWVMLSLLVFDPFMQAVISFEGELDELNEPGKNAVISRISRLDTGQWQVGASLGFVNTSVSTLSQRPMTGCRSRNCTWPVFSSIDLCSSCVDISSHIRRKREKLPLPVPSPLGVCESPSTESTARGSNCTTHTVLYGTDAHGHRSKKIGTSAFLGMADFVTGNNESECIASSVKSNFHPHTSYAFSDWDTLIVSFAILRFEDAFYTSPIDSQDVATVATECAIRLCGHVWKVALFDGNLTESATVDAFERVPLSFQLHGPMNQTVRDQQAKEFGKSLTSFRDWYYLRDDLQLSLPDAISTPDTVERSLNISQRSIESMVTIFGSSEVLRSMEDSLARSTNLSETFAVATRFLSNLLRETDGHELVVGSSYIWVIHIRVRWAFLALHAVALIASLVFIFGTMLETRRKKLDIVKADLLPVLTYDPDGDLAEALRRSGVDRGATTTGPEIRHRLPADRNSSEDGGDGVETALMIAISPRPQAHIDAVSRSSSLSRDAGIELVQSQSLPAK